VGAAQRLVRRIMRATIGTAMTVIGSRSGIVALWMTYAKAKVPAAVDAANRTQRQH